MDIPSDPVILLSYINTMLRDQYSSLNELCEVLNVDREKLCEDLSGLDYHYDEVTNRFM